MKLSNFEQWIEDKVLERGQGYFKKGKILNLTTSDEIQYTALVDGSKVYRVNIYINGDVVVNAYCDCPYDLNKYCKHKAAVLYALRDKRPERHDLAVIEEQEKKSVNSILQSQNKEDLINIILDLTEEFPDIEKRLIFKFSPDKEEISSAKKLIQEYITGAKRKGFINWRHIGQALKGADLTLQKAQSKLDAGDTQNAVLLSLTVLTPVVKMLQHADDSDGSAGSIINWALRILEKAVSASVKLLPEKEQKKLFEAILKELQKAVYDDWSDWRYDLLRICTHFSHHQEIRKKLEKQLDNLLEKSGTSWNANYDQKEVKLIQLEIIETCEGLDEARKFIYENINISEFRKKAIVMELDSADYKNVIQLCLEGESADQAYPGLVKEWKEYRYQAYEILGDIEKQRELARELLYKNEFKYYQKLKELYPVIEWEAALREIVEEFRRDKHQPSAYVSILIEEDLKAELLCYCQDHMMVITEYYPYLIKDFTKEVTDVFIQYIHQSADEAADRKKYRKVCDLIKIYKKACGTIPSHQLITDLRDRHKKRPAFLEELARIR
ncbi:SWIM zinc finger family protein [Neobacillus cucumis]|uniref:SWIM zinc finger family protein n=1 Tax=Neobacillus cucumis TaxID=1740721 RepID=UPI002040D7D1|nr:SWIM zinc finger family protein [Neobacillus cucumis]MCM3728105.1 SWIM zinc finger family protein [Neobacillus cucumis]